MTERDHLGEFEQIVLLAILRLRHNAYGVGIREEIKNTANRDVSVGALYTTLERLEKKGFVSSWEGDPTPERGGRAKKYFRVEGSGLAALDRARNMMSRLWAGIGNLGSAGA